MDVQAFQNQIRSRVESARATRRQTQPVSEVITRVEWLFRLAAETLPGVLVASGGPGAGWTLAYTDEGESRLLSIAIASNGATCHWEDQSGQDHEETLSLEALTSERLREITLNFIHQEGTP